ncbi:Bug family tripartite tricarboxylate transporter substrate binding protein [Schauerella aestuarii]|uniref:Bug family tripartite tricarboxylate transporter substrate binding protein n=1 Tax=Schauerella aestuarii TaxID=2511204 RepID=UPI0013680E1E|nr:tripartite tricarboxylate transporter substrate binding protein [Achromobacter aestuarii]MYZ45384.1 tripartite tricarboxylate transporter substrate binding protein [Achromobacter aestuarii]
MIKKWCSIVAIAAVAGLPGAAFAQDFPNKPIRLIVPFTPGGGTDFLSRAVGNKMGDTKGWTVVVENKAGAGGTIGINEAIRGEATGYEMVMGQLDNLVVAPLLYKQVTYNAERDLMPVAAVADSPVVLVTNAASPYKTLDDVVKAAKAAPGTVTYASAGTGTVPHLVMEIFQTAAGIKINHIPYKGSAPAVADVLGGQVALLSTSVPSALAQIQAGKLRAIAVTSAKRSATLPDVPTIAESGYKDFDYSVWYALFVPKNSPKDVISILNKKVNDILALPATQKLMADQGVETRPGTPEALGQRLKEDNAKWRDVVAKSGVTLD